MIIKGRYVGKIEYDFEVDLSKDGWCTPQEFKENFAGINTMIEMTLKETLFSDPPKGCEDKLTVTQQYLDMYEVEG